MANNDVPLEPAEVFFVTARAYISGAHAIVKSAVRATYDNDVRFIIPCEMLVGHALEVYFKAWLSAHDDAYTPNVLRHDFGHNLRKLYEEAKLRGLQEPVVPPQQTFHDLVESYEKDHSDYSLRYPNDGWSFEVPKNDILFAILKRLDAVVASKVGGIVPKNLDWSVGPDEDFRSSTP